MKTLSQSNTIRLGVVQILSGAAGYLGGQMDVAAAGSMVVFGIIQIVQRLMALRKEAAQSDTATAPQGQ